jgi:hypothetical protein
MPLKIADQGVHLQERVLVYQLGGRRLQQYVDVDGT